MSLLDRLERRFRRYAVHNLAVLLVGGHVVGYVLAFGKPEIYEAMLLRGDAVLSGEWWRLFSFLLVTPQCNPFFLFFGLYLFLIMGQALEGEWGAFRFNVYFLIGYAMTVAVAFILPDLPVGPYYVEGSVFLAFAHLYPNFEIHLFFLLPIKVKWLALITWIGYGLQVVAGDWVARLLVLAAVINFLLFFGREVWWRMRSGHRSMVAGARRARQKGQAFHRCAVCGVTEKTHPDVDFRVCRQCGGATEYCEEHLRDHEHVQVG